MKVARRTHFILELALVSGQFAYFTFADEANAIESQKQANLMGEKVVKHSKIIPDYGGPYSGPLPAAYLEGYIRGLGDAE